MKKTSVLLFAAAVMLSSCGIMVQQSSTGNGHQFQDGIYSSSPSFISKDEKEVSQQKTEELVQKTKSSEIYLLGDKKDTIMIPENMSARIQLNNQKVGGTVITVGENPYDWRWDLENNYGYYYGPYSLGSSWYWSRHYSPYWSSWGYSPWYYDSWYRSSWYYTGWYDPWYYNPWYGSSWYFGLGYYGGWYGCYDPWYYSWHDPWHHYHHHHHHGWYNPPHYHRPSHGLGPGHITVKPGGNKNRYTAPRAHTNGSSLRRNDSRQSGGQSATASRTSTTVRRGIGTSSSTSRNASVSRSSSSSTSRSATTSRSGSTTYRRPASSTSSSSSTSSGSSYSRSSSKSSSSSSGSSYNRSSSSSSGSYNRSSGGYSRSSSYSGGSGGYSRSSSSSGGGGYSRSSSSSGSYRR